MKDFRDLEVWKEARKFRNNIFLIAKDFPKEEKYKIVDQIIRSSRSVSANIAEGYGRFHYQENIQFCRQARGSLTETLDHLICAFDSGIIDENKLKELEIDYNQILKLLNGYIAYLKQRKEEV
ncbi:MAG TPA: four helix bundle protein [Bacteroidia bacterium]|nr:four helix bundle protein [Bacteroidia bacterium]